MNLDYLIVIIMLLTFIKLIYNVKVSKTSIQKQIKKGKYYILELNYSKSTLNNYLTLFTGMFFSITIAFISSGEFFSTNFMIFSLVILIFILLLWGFLFYYKREENKFKLEKKLILKNGYAVPGIVIDEIVQETHNNTTRKHFSFLIKFTKNGEEITYITPEIAFSKYKLASYDVDVYIYEDKYYVTNYKIKE